MWSSLRIAASGLQAQQRSLEVASDNLANLQTTGFKVRRANLVDLPPSGVGAADADPALLGALLADEARLAAVLPNWAPGAILPTGQPLDAAIKGAGFLPVTLPNGEIAYTRDVSLRLDGTGQLVTAAGYPVVGVTLPPGVRDLRLEPDGRLLAETPGGPVVVGQLVLTRFANPDGLARTGDNLLRPTANSGAATTAVPGSNGLGVLVPGALEASNVDVADELTRVLQAQRAYQANLSGLRTVLEMLDATNDLRRS